ncbi:unnamed protein product [Closterium sp. NIES-53]
MNKADNDSSSRAIDSLINYETVKYFNNEEHEAAMYDTFLKRYEVAARKTQSSLSLLNFGQNAIFSAALAYTMLKPSVSDIPDARPLELKDSSISLEGVTFGYHDEKPILNGVSLHVPGGKSLAIVGPSGSGKSTVLRLLYRFFDADSGSVSNRRSLIPLHPTSSHLTSPHPTSPHPTVLHAYLPPPSPILPLPTLPSAAYSVSTASLTHNHRPMLTHPHHAWSPYFLPSLLSPPPPGPLTTHMASDKVPLLPTTHPRIIAPSPSPVFPSHWACPILPHLVVPQLFPPPISRLRLAFFLSSFPLSLPTHSSLRSLVPPSRPQVLFNDSIMYNIRYGRPTATDEEVYEAARQAAIHEQILEFPKGYDTMVGERGLKISGGEKQRVALARTFLKGAPILLCDEATSALDSVTEGAILTALQSLARNRTSIFVAHRLTTAMQCDEIVVLDEGRIIERGNHASLLALNGTYADMWRQQNRPHGEDAGEGEEGGEGEGRGASASEQGGDRLAVVLGGDDDGVAHGKADKAGNAAAAVDGNGRPIVHGAAARAS